MAIITIDENNYITNYYTGPGWVVENGIEIENGDELEKIISSNENIFDYQYINKRFIKDEAKEILTKSIQKIEELRGQRKNKCFPIINRGTLWYETLNENQKNELREWYQSWLDITETLVIPEKPIWLE